MKDEDILAVVKAIDDAEVPFDNRMMYYYKLSWWRHPFKRFKQKRHLEGFLSTDKNRPLEPTEE